MNTIKTFIRKNKSEFLCLAAIVLIALCLRLFKINQFLTFLGDEGRDVRIVRDIITKGNLVFIGPQTSVGNMYLGPLYYYLITPALAIFGLSPVGPAVMNVLIGTITVIGVWFVGRQWFSVSAGLLASLFYALSPVAIIYSRSSWNPNPTPLFALLCAYGIYRVWQKKEYKWILWTGISLGFALQMHYLALLLIPFLGIFWLLTLKEVFWIEEQKKSFLKYTLYAFLSFCLLMSPLVLFDLKHQGMNFNAFKTFFTNRETTVNLNPARSDRFIPVIITTVTDLFLARQNIYAGTIAITTFILSVFFFKFSKKRAPLTYLFVWLGFSILGLGVYKQHVYIHYLGFIYPAVYLLLGFLLSKLITQKSIFVKLMGFAIISSLIFLNIKYSPVKDTPNNQLKNTESAVDLIIKESGDKPFNFGLIAKQNYDESYRYFFENKNSKMVRSEVGITDQLFVICEDGDICQPEGNPAYQIAAFGASKTVNQWNLANLKIYKLVPKK